MINKSEEKLYIYLGEALSMIQYLEDCLSHSIIIKKEPRNISRMQADEILKKYRSYTLGRAVVIAKKEELFVDSIQQKLSQFLTKRNWLVHKSIAQNQDRFNIDELTIKIKLINKEAMELTRFFFEDLIEYCSSKGCDMSKVIKVIKRDILD